MKQYGYARVSSADQNLRRQLDALEQFGVDEIVTDKTSGKSFDRPGYKKLLRKLRCGDTLVVSSLDRLGRNYSEILSEWRTLTQTKGVDVVVLDMPLLDTRNNAVGGVTGIFLSDMVLQLLSYVSQIERENIHERQRQGIAAARERGVNFGRPRSETPDEFETAAKRVNAGEISLREGAEACGMTYSTFRRRVFELRERERERERVLAALNSLSCRNNTHWP